MPKSCRYLHKSTSVFMCLLFGGMGLINARLMAAQHTVSDNGRLFVSFLFVLLAVGGIGVQSWFQRRMIAEFRYDGLTLEFRTIGIPEPQVRALADITLIREWRGKGGSIGYRLRFQDRQKLYLEFSVSNSIALANRLRADLRNNRP